MTTINRDEWLHALKEAGIDGDIQADPDALTTDQLSQLWGCSVDTTRSRMKKLLAQGLAVQVTIRGGAQNHPIAAFKLTK